MRTIKYPSIKFESLSLQIDKNRLDLKVGSHSFYAIYPKEFNLPEIPDGWFDLMMYVLFHGLERIDMSQTGIQTTGSDKMVSYSGGADSTAVLVKYGGTPIHIYRDWNLDYEHRQIRAVKNIGGLSIATDFEKVRSLYVGSQGFNIGVGYACMFFPMMPYLGADTVYFGVVFDDISFFYAEPFKYVSDFVGTRTYKLIQEMKEFGINFEFPMAGYSEVLTTQIADAGGIKNFSSCNTLGSTDACLHCYKCFRKEAIRGRQIEYRKLIKIFEKYPLKMASSTIYGVQNAGYSFAEQFDIDVSFLDRINIQAQKTFFNGEKLPEYEWQTDDDLVRIGQFVQFINSHKDGFKWK